MGQNIACRFLFFGSSKELIDKSLVPAEWPVGTTVADIRFALDALAPGLSSLRYAIAVNQVYSFDTDVIPADAEIAILPPVSGG